MKTIFVTSFHQFISRNILRTPILDGLLAIPDARIVIVAPADKGEYFKQEFARENVIIECVSTSRAANGFWSFAMKRLAREMGGSRYKEVARGFPMNAFRDFALGTFCYYPARLAGAFRAARAAMRFLNARLVRSRVMATLFDRYAPDLVFATDVQNESDALLMTEARRRGVPIVSMVRSWDNVEMYGILRVIPEALLVWGEFVKQEILRQNAIDPGRVLPVGVPHYDRYLAGPTMPRAEFLRSIGADPRRKLILYAPVGDMYLRGNDVDGLVLAELAKTDANILVRTPPADTVSFGGGALPPNAFFYRPGAGAARVGRREISRQDDDHLINSLRWCDLVVSGPSSIMLDAALLDKPVLLFGFEATAKPRRASIASLYDSRHLQAVIGNGGARLAKSISEFHSAIAEYLRDPSSGAAGRKRAVDFVCCKTDGKSCERVLNVLKSSLDRLTD